VIGHNVVRHTAIARDIVAAGHDIENHSHSHPLFALRRPSFVAEDIGKAQDAIFDSTGRLPAWVRAPYGVRWFGFRKAQRKLRLRGVMWSVNGLDWKLPAPAIERRILSRAGNGDIICLHDGRGTLENPDLASTVAAVERIVPLLVAEGYRFETVSELLCQPIH
jgi:peptidoglycan/xylan/chitin deacetylase (PgdA/CDA1 family)